MSFGYQMLGFGGGGGTPTPPPVDAVLATALARYTADDIVGSNPVTEWTNSGTGGASYDFDTVVGTAANLIKLESNSAHVPGNIGDGFTTPDSAAISFTGDFTLIICMSSDSWETSDGAYYIAKAGANPNFSYYISIDPSPVDGAMRVGTTPDGTYTNQVLTESTAAIPFSNGDIGWLRVTHDLSANTMNFYTSTDARTTAPTAVSWTQLGAADVTHSTSGVADGNADLEIGGTNGLTAPINGNVYRAIGMASTDPTSTPAWDFNPADASPNVDTWTSSGAGGEVWTINGDAMVNATSYDAVYAKGSVGLETTSGTTLSDPNTVFAVAKWEEASPSAQRALFDSRSDNTKRHKSYNNGSPGPYIMSGNTDLSLAEPFVNDLNVMTYQWNGDSTSKLTVSGTGTVTGDAGSHDWDFGSLGMLYNTGGNEFYGAIYEFIVFDSALSEDDIALVQDYLETKYELANAETLLATALVHYTPADIVGTFPVTEWTNSGTGGASYDLDTVVGTAANLISVGSKAAGFPNIEGSYFSTPDTATNSVTGSIEMVCRMAGDWGNAGGILCTKYQAASATQGYSFNFDAAGTLSINFRGSGGNVSAASDASVSFSAGDVGWIRCTWNDTTDECKFYTAADEASIPSSWTQLGTTQTITSSGIVDSSNLLTVGATLRTGGGVWLGEIYRMVVYDGIGGTVAFDFNPSDAAVNASTWTSSGSSGETWTLVQDVFVNTTDYAGVFASGGVGIETTTGTNIATPYTVIAAVKHIEDDPAANVYLHSHRLWDGTNLSYLYIAGGSAGNPWLIHQDGSALFGPNSTNDLFVISAQYNSDATSNMITDGGSATGDIGEGAFDFGSLFINDAGAQASEMVMWEYMVFGSKLTASEIGTIRNHLLTKYGV